ncbi:MAG: SDR family oxidoreductase [Beijerinckiaceae bacterium]|nr:SDR family oxidoreductase [Beijerinckiaceae bacterium]
MLKKMRLEGEVVVVTGGGAGIGKAAALSLAELGATVALVGRTPATLEETRSEIIAVGGACECFVADVSREHDVFKIASLVEAKWGRVKAIINNAGTNFRSEIADLSTEKWREINAANLDSVFFMCRAFIPLLLRAEGASILNVASSFGLIGNPKMPVYCATKGAVVNLSRQLAIDYGRKGLRVNSICPGPTLSPRVRGYIEGGQTDGRALQAQVMLGRLAECHEIGDVAAFLVTDASSFINGATIVVDGGQTIN